MGYARFVHKNMIINYIYAFGSVFAISLISLVGVFTLSLKEEVLKKYIFLFISLAVGALLGDVFIHLIPEAFEISPGLLTSILLVAGIMLFFVLEQFFHWHHHGEDKEVVHEHSVGKLVLFSDGLHNIMDGIIIGASFMISIPIGLATTLAVVLHEIPQEIGDFAVLIHSGYTKGRALWLNFLSALFAILGVVIAIALGETTEVFNAWLLPIAAGGFIYIALADLVPELQKSRSVKRSIKQLIMILVGVGLMAALTLLE